MDVAFRNQKTSAPAKKRAPKVTPLKVMITFNEMLNEQIVGHLDPTDAPTT